jgi:hypothetical protein
MNLFDALRNAVNFSREEISSVVKDREKINAAIRGIDSIADSRTTGNERLAEYAPKRRELKSSIGQHSTDIKRAVDRSEKRQIDEIDKLAASYFESLQTQNNVAKKETADYHNNIRKEFDVDWGESRIFARIDRSIAAIKEIENRTYPESRKELTDALDQREARILTAVSQTPEVQKIYNVAIEKKQQEAEQHNQQVMITGAQLQQAMRNKYNKLQEDINAATIQNSQLLNARYLQNNAKNNLTGGEYRKLHEQGNQHKQQGNTAKYNECVEMIKMIDKRFMAPDEAQKLQGEMSKLQTQYNDVIGKNNDAIATSQTTMNSIGQEMKKLKGLENAHIRIESKSIIKIIDSPSYQKQISELRRKEISSAIGM